MLLNFFADKLDFTSVILLASSRDHKPVVSSCGNALNINSARVWFERHSIGRVPSSSIPDGWLCAELLPSA